MQNKNTSKVNKILLSVMTLAFSFVAFAQAQSCTLLPGFVPNILIDGVSRTAYQIPEATYTQSCLEAQGTIRCDYGTLVDGNIFKYPSCIPHTRSNCTTPTLANHLEYKTLYKASQSTYTQTCQQLSQTLQCLNGIFTGGTHPELYTKGSCVDSNRSQCIDTRTNSFKDHGETIVGYASSNPVLWQTCTTLQRTLTCINGTRSGGNQATLNRTCANPPSFAPCTNIRTNTVLPHGTVIYGYTSPTWICNNIRKALTCTNGLRAWGTQSALSSTCTEINTAPCPNILTASGVLAHGTFITMYTQATALGDNNKYCTDYIKTLKCVNGTRSWNQSGLFTGCQNIEAWSCFDAHTNKRIAPFGTIYRYTISQPTASMSCAQARQTIHCINGTRSGGNINNSPTCGNCLLPRWGILAEGASTYGYSTILRATTGQNYTAGCSPFSGHFMCVNSMIQLLQWTWGTSTWSYTSSIYRYSLDQCQAWQARNCSFVGGTGIVILNHGQSKTWYSQMRAEFPKTCEKNYATKLTCINGSINGNYQTYKYSGCTGETLKPGIDIAIDSSNGLLGQENISGGVIAQWSSPQISILFQNKWDTAINQENVPAGFLSCTRKEQNLPVYSSKILSSFVVNPGTKVGVNIRIMPLFTQSLGYKTLECKALGTSVWDTLYPTNNVWSWKFEIVEAGRFDLALSKSIESISKNLEAAEGAVGPQWAQNFVYNKIMNVLLPLIIVLWILSAILWFYKVMFSSEDKAVAEWTRYIIFWVVGIIFIMSAKFIGQNIFDLLSKSDIKWFEMASGLYNTIVYPFIKFAIYLVLGAMFVILLSRVITFLFGTDSDATKKAGTIIWWNVISMIIIIAAKQIIEAIYGKQETIVKDITNLGEIWSGVLADKNIPILYQIINYALWIASLVILVVIIIQTIQLLMKPDDPAQVKSIKNSLVYMFIGILVLGAGYLIVNFAIIN